MQILEGRVILSATDLAGFLACEHLTTLELGAARGEWKRPVYDDPVLDFLQKKGGEHERRCLESFEAEGKGIVPLGPWSYQPADAKLAQRVEAAALLQLSVYANRVSQLQGIAPEEVAVVTGDGELHWKRLRDYSAYYRAMKGALEARLFTPDGGSATYPNPVEPAASVAGSGSAPSAGARTTTFVRSPASPAPRPSD